MFLDLLYFYNSFLIIVRVLITDNYTVVSGWSYADSLYFCFATLTTIGFGDFVALQQNDALEKQVYYVIFVISFILFGLAIIAACLNLMVLKLMTLNTADEKRDEEQAMQVLFNLYLNNIHIQYFVIFCCTTQNYLYKKSFSECC